MKSLSVALILFISLSACARAETTASSSPISWADRLKVFQRELRESPRNHTSAEMADFVEAQYQKLGFPDEPSGIESEGLEAVDAHAIFDALKLRTVYTEAAANALALEKFALALQGRFGLKNRELHDVYHTFILTRQFVRAQAWHEMLDPAARELLPRFIDSPDIGPPSVWKLHEQNKELSRVSLGDLKGARVLAIVSPGCHFSVAATTTLAENKALFDRLAPITTWIVPPMGELHFSEIQAWNAKHPRVPLVLAHRAIETPFLADWSTPTFYFLYDEKLIRRVTGWPKEGNLPAVESALDEITPVAAE